MSATPRTHRVDAHAWGRRWWSVLVAIALGAAGCGGAAVLRDARVDAGTRSPDAASADAGAPATDAGPLVDGGVADAGPGRDGRGADAGPGPDGGAIDAGATSDGGADAGASCVLGPHPLIQPAGFTGYLRTWPEVFDGRAFPGSPSSAMPVGAWTIARSYTSPSSTGMYLSIPIDLGPDQSLNIFVSGAVPAPSLNYGMPRAGLVFLSLSPCPGDVRPLDSTASDVYARACRGLIYEGAITFNTRAAGSCRVAPGRYWVTFMHADSRAQDFSPSSTTCTSGTACESSVTPTLY